MTPPSLDRRTLIGAAAAAAAGAGTLAASTAEAVSPYFKHGVASGDPLPRAVVIWTRVTPMAAALPGSGKGPRVDVTWQVATDAAFTRIVKRGLFGTGPGRDHTVKVDVGGLRPATHYYYRFLYNGGASRVGRMKTAPAANSTPARVRFGLVSCSNIQAGWFSAYRHLAKRDDLDAVLHLGDYIYEYGPDGYGYGQDEINIRKHVPPREIVSLSDYRRRHAQYKTDPDLAALHARYAFIATWDDHEVTNDRFRTGAGNHNAGEGIFKTRQAAAYRAYDEWMPIRLSGTAALNDGSQIYRRLKFGQLAELTMLDLRTYRHEQIAATIPSPVGPTISTQLNDPKRTITGQGQMDYLKASLNNSRAQWKLVGNPVMIAPLTFVSLPHDVLDAVSELTGISLPDAAVVNTDQWDGYAADRKEVLNHLRDRGVKDAVFLTGDIHSAWASDLPTDPGTYPLINTSAGVEFVTTSVTSNNLKDILGTPRRTASKTVEGIIRNANRHIKYVNFDDHGFAVLDVTAARAQVDYFIIGDRKNRNAGLTWERSYQTRSGTSKVVAVSKPVSS